MRFIISHNCKFQSTLSARRATNRHYIIFCILDISIHALREESDKIYLSKKNKKNLISIHALREESDSPSTLISICFTNFNPRSPRGERHHELCLYHQSKQFQSTLSARRATQLYHQHP